VKNGTDLTDSQPDGTPPKGLLLQSDYIKHICLGAFCETQAVTLLGGQKGDPEGLPPWKGFAGITLGAFLGYSPFSIPRHIPEDFTNIFQLLEGHTLPASLKAQAQC